MHRQNASNVSISIRGMVLAQAFVNVRKAGFTLRVNKIDGRSIQPKREERDYGRVNVDVFDGVVKHSWIG